MAASSPGHYSGLPIMDTNTLTPEIIQLAEDLLALKLYFAGCFALLFFDYFLTLADEVELIWKANKTSMFYLFVMNRYCPLAFAIITLFAYVSPLWTHEVCNRFAIVEWLQTLLIVVPAEIVLLFRVFALMNRNRYICTFLWALILAECIIVFYAMSLPGTNNALPLPHFDLDSFQICILYSDPHMDTAYLAVTIAFDSIVFGLTIFATFNRVRSQVNRANANANAAGRRARSALHSILRLDDRPGHTSILGTMRWDGTLYFCVILSGNIVWMGLALYARPGLKFMNAQPSMYMTSVMINRLTLSVRKVAVEANSVRTSIEWPSAIFSRAPPATPRTEFGSPRPTTLAFAQTATNRDSVLP
ncbi:hypothetical protein MIND_01359900 [Mycena indigotica]|uniref:DUF6533 domain-containing protein n=1 Tax=Mycena indigotica TaxID=2126181 RepID=A0A8H6S207_9AGAR|nr:uncharacterized protein MIND_01359900 [Mycena indigotica]KAF7289855.1 hypothetical protein MIND_01359900 [Mycena indigotica]